eukprot:8960248-Lingulodinium_polyedra.AAC.1
MPERSNAPGRWVAGRSGPQCRRPQRAARTPPGPSPHASGGCNACSPCRSRICRTAPPRTWRAGLRGVERGLGSRTPSPRA